MTRHTMGGCSSHRNASGICSAGYGRRVRHVSRLYMSCHNLHSIYLSWTEHECDQEKKLGVYTCPTGNFSYHVAQLLTMGLKYVERLGAQKLLARDAWMGTHY
jgi:hypothetical protein